MQKLIHLGLQGFVIAGIMIAQGLYGAPCGKIQVLLSLCVIEIHALSVIQYNLIAVIGMEHALLCFFDNSLFIFLHNTVPLPRPEWRFRFLCW